MYIKKNSEINQTKATRLGILFAIKFTAQQLLIISFS